LGANRSNTDAVFEPLLDKELKKVCSFYAMQQKELLDDVEELQKEIEEREQEGFTDRYADEDDEEEDDDSISRSPDATLRRKRNQSLSLSRPHIS
jgi:phosphate transporter